jgi:hypothetical protein
MPELDDDGERVLAEWCAHYKPSEETLGYIKAVLRDVTQGGWHGHWKWYPDESDLTITIIEPRGKLLVCVRLWAGDPVDQFTLVRIIDGDFD